MPKKREKVIVEGVNYWKCKDCGQLLPETEFYTNNGRVEIYCKKCSSIRKKKGRKKNGPRKLTEEQKEIQKQYLKEYRIRNRERLVQQDKERYIQKWEEEHGLPYVPREIKTPEIVDGVIYWQCCHCEQMLPESEFSVRSNGTIVAVCKSCKREYNKKYYKDNKERLIICVKEYAKKNKEKKAQDNRKWKIKNREKLRAYMHEYSQQYYKQNKEKVDARNIKYYYENKEKFALYVATRKGRSKKVIVSLTPDDWQDCLEYFDYKDAYTGLPMKTISQDHVIPLFEGGNYTRQNIIPCENSINKSKGTSDMETWYKKQSYFSEERLRKIYKWMGYKPESNMLQIALF